MITTCFLLSPVTSVSGLLKSSREAFHDYDGWLRYPVLTELNICRNGPFLSEYNRQGALKTDATAPARPSSSRRAAAFLSDSSFWPWVSIAVCFAYGLLLIALIHTVADGRWYWYAHALRHGQHLYRDLHLPLQPLYPMELALFQAVLGTSWLAQQGPGLLNLVLFLAALALITRSIRQPAWQRALLFACAFTTCMTFIMMRFDDFHVLATSLELGCAALLLRLADQPAARQRYLVLGALGALSGLCILTRVNDGGLLLGAVLVIACLVANTAAHRIEAPAVILACSALTVVVVLAGIGESVHTWWFYSIQTAAQIKGGSNHLLLYPLRLPLGTLHEFTLNWRFLALAVYALALGALAFWLSHKRDHSSPLLRRALLACAVVLTLPLWHNLIRGNAARVLVAFAVLATYAVTFVTSLRLYFFLRGKPKRSWGVQELIIFIPLAQLISISLSAARWYPNTNPPAALFLVLLPVCAPWLLARREARAVFYTWVALLTISAGIDKLRNPFDWFNYRARSFDAERVWYRHPSFGPMLIETAQRDLMLPVCAAVQNGSQPPQLLSLPFVYANYFCNVPPWHGYTQTFYDTSSRATIAALERELLTAPPEWIVYQRQLDILARNEEAFNNGRPLPHRDLDRLIDQQLRSGQWAATALPSPPRDTSTWMLIHTQTRTR